jgi:hypothetical protein
VSRPSVHRSRLEAQLLGTGRAPSTEAVIDRLLAVQAQDRRGARLAIRARSTVVAATDVDAALTHRRSAVVTWLNRGTLHLVRAADYFWLHPLTAPAHRAANLRRLGQEGLGRTDVERGVDAVREAVAGGPRTRGEVRSALEAAGVPTAGQALIQVLFAASLRGHLVRGPLRQGEWAYVDVADWLGPAPDPVEPQEGLGRLAVRYLDGHGPAGVGDLAKWAGVTVGQARTGLQAAGDRVVPLGDDLFGPATARPAQGRVPRPRLLGAFDPMLLGWADRTPVVGAHRGVVTTNGIFRPTVLVGGRVVGTWGLRAGRVSIRLFERLSSTVRRSLERDAVAVLDYLGVAASERVEQPEWTAPDE